MFKISLFFAILSVAWGLPKNFSKNGFEPLNVVQMIQSKGYPVQSHQVKTDDGYLLTMHRIPYGRAFGPSWRKPVVFLQHGLLSSSADWIVAGPDNDALAYLLADRGYDVWMGNVRGNTWSRKHVTLNPDGPTRQKFWDFTWHEIAIYDIPAMIDYVRELTQRNKLHYIGHSQGTTVLFVMLSLRPEYNDVILSGQALSPIAFMSRLKSPFFRAFAPINGPLDVLTNLLGLDEFLPSTRALQLGGYLACRDTSPIQELCTNALFLIFGYDSQQFNRTILSTILANTPAGAATKQFIHYLQLVNSGRFCQFDYGLIGNLRRYGRNSPPDYPLDRITAPLALHYSENDWVCAVEDVAELVLKLSNNVNFIGSFRVPFPAFNHLDYLIGIDVKYLLFDRVISIIRYYDEY